MKFEIVYEGLFNNFNSRIVSDILIGGKCPLLNSEFVEQVPVFGSSCHPRVLIKTLRGIWNRSFKELP